MSQEIIKSITTCAMEITEILDDLTGVQNLERTLHKIVKNLSNSMNCQTCAVIRINPKTEKLEILNSHGLSWQFCKDFRQRTITPLLGEIIWKSEPILIGTAGENPELVNQLRLEHDFKSCYAVQLMANQRPLGYLYVDSKDENFFNADLQLITQLYAKIISLAFHKENLLRDLQKHAEKNEKTGAIAYTIFYNRLQEAIARAQRLEENLSLILIDVVKFDQLLTSYGDEVCSELMNEIMSLINTNVRKYDTLSKFGVDEIIISLPGSTGEDAMRCITKLYNVITGSGLSRHELNIDLSVGVATFPDNAKTVDGLLISVKHALLECKRNATEKILKADTFFA